MDGYVEQNDIVNWLIDWCTCVVLLLCILSWFRSQQWRDEVYGLENLNLHRGNCFSCHWWCCSCYYCFDYFLLLYLFWSLFITRTSFSYIVYGIQYLGNNACIYQWRNYGPAAAGGGATEFWGVKYFFAMSVCLILK